jgi:hypothetical protein
MGGAMKRSASLIGAVVIAALLMALPAASAQAKSRQCGTTVRTFGDDGYRFKVWVAKGPTSCTQAKRVMGRAFTPKAVKGWKCIDATKGGGAPKSYSDECRKGGAIVRGDLLGKAASAAATAHAAFTGRCKTVALTAAIDASVVVRNDTCVRGRSLVKAWLAAGGGARRLRKVNRYTCVFGGDVLLVLRCTRGSRVVRAEWGD